nr:LysR family transcriptional regulator [Marinifaba aquimaris]
MVFVQVVEQGNFTKAADVLGLPKSNISRKISRLESELKVLLLERTTRALRLTEMGQLVYEHAKRVEEELNASFDCIDALSEVPQGKLRFCTSNTIGIELIAPIVAKFHQQYPKVELLMKLANRRVDLIEENYDFAIRVGLNNDSSLIAKPIYRIKMKLFASKDYLAQYQAITHPQQLVEQPCLFMNTLSNIPNWQLSENKDTTKQDYAINATFTCDDFMVIRQACLDSMGIALLPSYMADKALVDGMLELVLPDWTGPELDLSVVYPSRKGATPKLKAMINYLSAYFAEKS